MQSGAGPCKTLAPVLEGAVQNRGGRVELAKVDIDELQDLAMNYKARDDEDVTKAEQEATVEFSIPVQCGTDHWQTRIEYSQYAERDGSADQYQQQWDLRGRTRVHHKRVATRRAVVEGLDANGTATLRFVDFGDTSVVELATLKALRAEYLTLPAQADIDIASEMVTLGHMEWIQDKSLTLKPSVFTYVSLPSTWAMLSQHHHLMTSHGQSLCITLCSLFLAVCWCCPKGLTWDPAATKLVQEHAKAGQDMPLSLSSPAMWETENGKLAAVTLSAEGQPINALLLRQGWLSNSRSGVQQIGSVAYRFCFLDNASHSGVWIIAAV
eukprot:Em0674g8a